MLVLTLKLLFLTLQLHANVCENLFLREHVHLSQADQRIYDLSENYKGWFEVSIQNAQYINSLQGQRVALITLRSSHRFQHYKIEKLEATVKAVEYSEVTNNPILVLKSGESVPWVRIQKLFIDPSKLSSSVFNESEKHFKLYHFSKKFKQNCIGCVEQGTSLGIHYLLNSKFIGSNHKQLIVFYDQMTKKIRTLKNANIEFFNSDYRIRDHRTGRAWTVTDTDVGYIGTVSPHSH